MSQTRGHLGTIIYLDFSSYIVAVLVITLLRRLAGRNATVYLAYDIQRTEGKKQAALLGHAAVITRNPMLITIRIEKGN